MGGEKIKNFIFDFGGVIINIDYGLTQKAFIDLGIENFDELYSKSRQSGLFDELETARISPAQFRDTIRQISGKDPGDVAIDRAWNAMLLDIPVERLKLLEQLKSRANVFLLSNTNEIHISEFSRQIDRQYGLDYFHSLFNKIYFSSRMGLRKPHREAFESVLDEHGLEISETLFIDDSIQHIEGAKAVGLHTFHLDKGMDILDLFNGRTGSWNFGW